MSGLVLDFAVDPAVAERLADELPADAERLRLEDLRRLGPWRALARLRRRRLDDCAVIVNDFRAQGRWLSILGAAMLTRARRRTLLDPTGARRSLTWGSLAAREIPFALRRILIAAGVRRRARAAVRRLPPALPPRPVRPGHVAFIRADLGPPLEAGGSLAHIRGVVGGLRSRDIRVTFLSPGPVLGFDADDETVWLLPPEPRYDLSQVLPRLAYNFRLSPRATEILDRSDADLVYHRHTLGGYAAALAARRAGLPLVVEFNGSEVWIERHWGGGGLEHETLFDEIERRALAAADLVVAVSESLRAQLHAAGVPDERILVNPNGVDPERFDPDALAAHRVERRRRLGLREDEILAGFVGTFGPWHGAEVLADAAVRLAERDRERIRLLFIGDGPRRARALATLEAAGIAGRATFTGMVPHDETPALLAACDVCVSPHVPNPDGSPFFGSPTKLFEYMASGRAVLASRLDQIGEVLEHDRNAWLVPPGDAAALARGLGKLAGDPDLRARLGRAARDDARRRHSWSAHVERILDRLAAPQR